VALVLLKGSASARDVKPAVPPAAVPSPADVRPEATVQPKVPPTPVVPPVRDVPPTIVAKADPPKAETKAKQADGADTLEADARDALKVAKDYEVKPGAKIMDMIEAYRNVVQVYPQTKAADEASTAIDRLFQKALAAPETSPVIDPARPPAASERVSLDGDAAVLKAAAATLHGISIRYEPAPANDDIGFWSGEEYVTWDVKISKPGAFAVEATYAAIGACAENEYTIAVGDQELAAKVKPTGAWTGFKTEAVGTLKITQTGDLTLTVKPKTNRNGALMNLRSITLKRTGD
jgi:hypothetical protein